MSDTLFVKPWVCVNFGWNWTCVISPLERTWPFIETNLNPLYPKMAWPSLVEVGKFYQCNLCNFNISSPWKRVWLIFLTNLNPLHPMMLFAMFVELAQWFWGRRFLKFCQCIFAISILFSLWDCRTLTGKIGNIHPLRFSSVTVQTLDVTVQWAETKLLQTSSKTLDWNVKFQSTCVYAINREKFCRINFLNKILIDARH